MVCLGFHIEGSESVQVQLFCFLWRKVPPCWWPVELNSVVYVTCIGTFALYTICRYVAGGSKCADFCCLFWSLCCPVTIVSTTLTWATYAGISFWWRWWCSSSASGDGSGVRGRAHGGNGVHSWQLGRKASFVRHLPTWFLGNGNTCEMCFHNTGCVLNSFPVGFAQLYPTGERKTE